MEDKEVSLTGGELRASDSGAANSLFISSSICLGNTGSAHIPAEDAWQRLKTIPEAVKAAATKTQQLLDEWEANSVVQ